jgi:hypothetical protein
MQALPGTLFIGIGFVPHEIVAATAHAGALPGITTGSNTMMNSFIQAAGCVGVGGMSWGATHLVHRPDDWVGGFTRIGAGGACSYVATQATPVSTQFGAGVTL